MSTDNSDSLDYLFQNARTTAANLQQEVDRVSGMTNRARQRAGLLRADEVPARQQAEGQQMAALRAAARAAGELPEKAAPAFLLDWNHTEFWLTPAGYYPIVQMADQHLWETVIWCVRNVEALHETYDHVSTERDLLSAKYWLRTQPAFRALLQESIRRQITFPPDVLKYIREYVMRQSQNLLATYQPWNDPNARKLQTDLDDFLNEPLKPDDSYKERRSIDLS